MTPTWVLWLILIFNYPRTNHLYSDGLSNGFIRISDSIRFNLHNSITQKPALDYRSVVFPNLPW